MDAYARIWTMLFGYRKVWTPIPSLPSNALTTLDRDMVVKAVCEEFKLSLEKLKSKSRIAKLVRARKALAFLLREYSDQSYKWIGELLGRDHTSAMHLYTSSQELMVKDSAFKAQVKSARERFQRGQFQ